MPKAEVNKNFQFIFILLVFVLLILSIYNINYLFQQNRVLGAEAENTSESDYWSGFLTKNPNYVPGLIESGNIDKAKEIDPNFPGL